MAGNYISINSKFNPFTFDELIKPVQMYQQAYDKFETDLTTLQEDTALNNFMFTSKDEDEKKQYDGLIKELETLTNEFNNYGLSNNVKSNLNKFNRTYKSQIIPLKRKIDKRNQLIAEQQKLKNSNPNIIFSIDYSDVGLKDINESSSYTTVNLKDYETRAFNMMDEQSKLKPVSTVTEYNNDYDKQEVGYGFRDTDKDNTDFNTVSSDIKGRLIEDYKNKLNITDDNDPRLRLVESHIDTGLQLGKGKIATTFVKKDKDNNGINSIKNIVWHDNPDGSKVGILGNQLVISDKDGIRYLSKNTSGENNNILEINGKKYLKSGSDWFLITTNEKNETVFEKVTNDDSFTTRTEEQLPDGTVKVTTIKKNNAAKPVIDYFGTR